MNDKDTQNLLENLYKSLSPKGFEFLIKVLLEKLGFDEIEVTGAIWRWWYRLNSDFT